MKKLILLAALACGLVANAQIRDDKNCFNHLSVGVNAGLTGLGVELGTTVTPIIGLRVGFEAMPKFKVKSHVDVTEPSNWYTLAPIARHAYLPNDDFRIDLEGQMNMVNGKILFDIFPGKNTLFHFTVGAYFGPSKVITLRSRGEALRGVEEFNKDIDNNVPGLGNEKFTLEGYELGIDKGRSRFDAKVNGFKPYVGIGVGRTVPRKRVGCKFEAGVMFWGKPVLHDHYKNQDVTSETPGIGDDWKDAFEISDKVIAYPVLKFSIFGRIF